MLSANIKNRCFFHVCVRGKPYVVSEDIEHLLDRWGNQNGFIIPDKAFFTSVRNNMRGELQKIFPEVQLVSEDGMIDWIIKMVSNETLPVISLGRVYDIENCHSIDATRLVDQNLLSIGLGSRDGVCLEDQILSISERIRGPVCIVDDVLFSGESHIDLMHKLFSAGICVEVLITSISIKKGVDAVLEIFSEIKVKSLLFYESVIDEICERDFYAGVPFSGKLIGKVSSTGICPVVPNRGALYFGPFGNVEDWASIPQKHHEEWGKFCLKQSIFLWEEIERVSHKIVLCSDVPRLPYLIPFTEKRFVDYLRRYLHSS